MTTVADRMISLSRSIQRVYEKLIKLLLKKSYRPTLDPLHTNSSTIHYYQDNVNMYTYHPTHHCLGWQGAVLTNFRIEHKHQKRNTKVSYQLDQVATEFLLKINKLAFSPKEDPVRNIQSIIQNKKSGYVYQCDVPSAYAFAQLLHIGRDINADMAASLRLTLFELESQLVYLLSDYPDIFPAYLEMVQMINCLNRQQIIKLIRLIATLSVIDWQTLDPVKQEFYAKALGTEFVLAFNSNMLVTILLQSGNTELILTCAYLFSLLKMLFIVFGFGELVPNIVGFEEYWNVDPYIIDTNFIDENIIQSISLEQLAIQNRVTLFASTYPMLTDLMGGPDIFPYIALQINMMSDAVTTVEERSIAPLGVVMRQSTDVLGIDDPDVAAAVRHIRDDACNGLTVDNLVSRLSVCAACSNAASAAACGTRPSRKSGSSS